MTNIYVDLPSYDSSPIPCTDIAGEVEKVLYSEVGSVPSAVETTVSSYTVPVAKRFYIHRIEVSGDNVAVYRVRVNGLDKAKKRTWWTKFNETFDFTCFPKSGLKVVAGDVVTVSVIHNSVSVGSFNASIQGAEVG